MSIERKSHALTYYPEKKLLDFLAQRIFKFVSANQLSLLAFLGAITASLAYFLAGKNLIWLHLANFGIFIHWFGDSLDGRTARLRRESRPKYGHYLDHILDSFSLTFIILGINYSDLTLQSTWLFNLILLLLLHIHVHLKTSVTGIIEMAYVCSGWTEARILVILINFVLLFSKNPTLNYYSFPLTLLDLIGVILFIILAFIVIKSVLSSLWGKEKVKED